MVGYKLAHQTQASRVMYINSADVDDMHEHTTHFTYTFKDAVHTRADEGMLVSLYSASVPYAFYNIRDDVNDTITYTLTTGNYFDLSGQEQLATPLQTFTIPAGNYTTANFKTAIEGHFTSENIGFAMTFSDISQKFSFSITDNTKHLRFWTDIEDSPRIELGLTSGTHNIYKDNPLTSHNVVDLNGSVHALFVRTNLPTNSVFESETGGASDVLGKIIINADPGGVITHSPVNSAHESLIHSNHVKSLTVRLADERNRLLDLNGLHFQVGILFKFVSLHVSPPEPTRPSLAPQPTQQPQQPKNKRQRRRQLLRKGKAKVRAAQQKATKNNEAPQPKE